jgi:hypothetical protein
MDIIEYQNKSKKIQEMIDVYEDQKDEIFEAQRELRLQQYRLDQQYHADRMASLNLKNGNIIVGFAKHKDYHFMMIQTFVIVNAETATHIETIAQNYACNDFYYSFGCGDKTVKMDDIIEMFDDFHVYVFDQKIYNELLMKMTMLEVTFDNFDSIVATYAAQAIQKISE